MYYEDDIQQPNKFQDMLLKGTKRVGDVSITVEGNEIGFVSEIKALGVCIDEQLPSSV